jgi:hypothetical protein
MPRGSARQRVGPRRRKPSQKKKKGGLAAPTHGPGHTPKLPLTRRAPAASPCLEIQPKKEDGAQSSVLPKIDCSQFASPRARSQGCQDAASSRCIWFRRQVSPEPLSDLNGRKSSPAGSHNDTAARTRGGAGPAWLEGGMYILQAGARMRNDPGMIVSSISITTVPDAGAG